MAKVICTKQSSSIVRESLDEPNTAHSDQQREQFRF
jgi:hypothetical protein